ncbi:PDR/VanB family oxidoreductase [Pseudogemmobacter sonorensis]|uniref:PDR/VanB family oxidoreductase n=1 Tax=Pseudogemmobacter sonorensis TaxID=2989681 RepID=UPI0036CC2826
MTELVAPGTGASVPVAPAGPLGLRVSAIRWLAPTIREIELSAPDGGPLPAPSAGAHIDLSLPGDLSRSYSLVNAPGDDRRYLVAVNRDAASRGGSAHICETMRVGDMLQVSAPLNTFPMADADLSVFFAGGIGITPVLSMIRAAAARGRNWELHYAVRDRDSGAYLPELAALAAATGGLVHLHEDKAAGGVMDIAPRVAAVPEGAHLYCCGPAPMIAAFLKATEGRPEATLHVEHFSNDFEISDKSFTVVLRRKGMEVTVPAGKTIIDALVEAGVRVNYSCREGVCGTCETRVIDGVPDHKDNVLSDREKASNKVIMICCSSAKSDRLVLDI